MDYLNFPRCGELAPDLPNGHQLRSLQELCSLQQQAFVKELYLAVLNKTMTPIFLDTWNYSTFFWRNSLQYSYSLRTHSLFNCHN